MNKIIVRITNGKQTYEEDVTNEIKEHFLECISNGGNPWLEKMDIDYYTRPIKENLMVSHSLDKYNKADENAHFIFGWMECFSQSDNVPEWMWNSKEIFIEVVVKE